MSEEKQGKKKKPNGEKRNTSSRGAKRNPPRRHTATVGNLMADMDRSAERSRAQLVRLAVKKGIKGADKMSSADIRTALNITTTYRGEVKEHRQKSSSKVDAR